MAQTDGGPVVVVYDPIHTIRWTYEYERSALAERGVRLELLGDPDQQSGQLEAADIVVVSQRLNDRHLELLRDCSGILCYSVGMDGVNTELAQRLGIPVANVAGYCTEEVSDHAIALLMMVQRSILPFAMAAFYGRWDVRDRDDFYSIHRVRDTVLGVVGMGRIGSRVAEKARGLGMKTIGFDPFVQQEQLPDVKLRDLEELLRSSDAVVLCAALTDTSRNLIGARELKLMKSDAVLVNVARGGLIDEAALAAALREGDIRAAALDVRSVEPPGEDDPLVGLDNVVLTQHMAATSVEAFQDIHRLAAERILEMLEASGRIESADAIGVDR